MTASVSGELIGGVTESRFRPGYFAMVMATGIVSLACGATGIETVSTGLFGLNCLLYVLFWACLISEMIRAGRQFFSRAVRHREAMDYLTIQAGTCVLGSQFASTAQSPHIAVCLLGLGTALWFVLTYAVLGFLTFQQGKPGFVNAANGSWLLLTVTAESLSILASLLVSAFASCAKLLVFFSDAFLLIGAALYLLIAPMIFYRLIFLDMAPDRFDPSYWILMGGAAITALAASLLKKTGMSEALAGGLAFLFWSAATWWIPLLVVLQVIRIRRSAEPIRYEPGLWSMVFPAGMYIMCTDEVGRSLGIHSLQSFASVLTYAALVIWALTFACFVASGASHLKRKDQRKG